MIGAPQAGRLRPNDSTVEGRSPRQEALKRGSSGRLGSDAVTYPMQLYGPIKEARMNRVTALLVGIAALAAIPTIAEAAQGCGRGMYYNGRRCVPQDDIGYRPHHRRYVEDDDIGYRRHHRPGVGVHVAPGIRLHLGHHPRSRHHYDDDD
jgi:hypothetical protein